MDTMTDSDTRLAILLIGVLFRPSDAPAALEAQLADTERALMAELTARGVSSDIWKKRRPPVPGQRRTIRS